ncbi:MAG TPA: hypothetical protein VG963_07490, partial [Polyangiaceae bacterium]|nr:hypothetical protein [Polyangiaceae bacterium]
MPTFLPQPRLRSRVVAIDIVDDPGGQRLVLPSTGAVLGFQLRGRVRAGEELLSVAGITGLQSGARTYSYQDATSSVLVRFTAQGAACLGIPVAKLTGHSVALADILPRARVAELSERLQAAPDQAACVALVEELLLELPFARDPVVSRAIERLSASES